MTRSERTRRQKAGRTRKSTDAEPASSPANAPADEPVNEVMLRGRVTAAPVERALPSGDAVVTLRVSVPRPEVRTRGAARPGADWVGCTVWTQRQRTAALRWRAGDVVELHGSLRRRYFRVGNGPAQTRLEVEVRSGRRVARSG